MIGEINKLDINNEAKLDVVGKLNTATYVIGYPEEVLDLQKVEEFYKELELYGTEGIIETILKLQKHNKKINNNPKSDWKRKIKKFGGDYLNYFIEENIICEYKW